VTRGLQSFEWNSPDDRLSDKHTPASILASPCYTFRLYLYTATVILNDSVQQVQITSTSIQHSWSRDRVARPASHPGRCVRRTFPTLESNHITPPPPLPRHPT